jgi:hypothetical protein
MSEDFITIKVHAKTRHTLRMIAAITDERLVALIDRLANAELSRKQEAQRYEAEYRAQAPGQD